jgi:hypothetical protein
MKRRILNVFYPFFIEWTFVSLIFVIFHLLSSQNMPLIQMMAIAAAASILFALLLELKHNLAKPVYFLVFMPLLFVAANLIDLELFYIGIMAILIFWRVLKFQQDSTSHSESIWLVVTFLIGVFVSPLAYFSGRVYLFQIVFLLIFQLLFILLGQFLLKWMEIESVSRNRFAVTYSKLLGVILLLAAVLTFGRDMLKEVFFIALQGIGWTLSLLLYPFFAWIGSPSMQARASKVFSRQIPIMENEKSVEQTRQVFDTNFWGPILFAILIGAAFYFIYKKSNLFRKQAEEAAVHAGFATTSAIDGPASMVQLRRSRNEAPVNLIRREVFQLEKFAHKKGMGRLNHEDIKEWFQRLDIQYDPRTIQMYEMVRYGERLDEELDGWFQLEIKTIKKQFNLLAKSRNEENNAGLKENFRDIFKR